MSGMPKTSKLFQFINYRMRVTLQDGRQFVGKFMAFDKHMNLIICDCEEFRKIVPKGSKKGLSKEECNFFAGEEKEEKRTLGLVILRGETIISMTVEGPPPAEESRIKTLQKEGIQLPGIAKSASRGMVIPTTNANAPVPGLNAPIPNLGGPSHAAMVPQMGRGMMPPMGGIPPPPFARGMPFPPPPPSGMPFPPGMGIPPVPPGFRGMPPPPNFGRGMPPFPPSQNNP